MAEFIYTPAWKTREGNRLIFLHKDQQFEDSGLAYAQQILSFPSFRQVGLEMDGVAKVEKKPDGTLSIPHVDVTMWYWEGHCISGPIFDAAESA